MPLILSDHGLLPITNLYSTVKYSQPSEYYPYVKFLSEHMAGLLYYYLSQGDKPTQEEVARFLGQPRKTITSDIHRLRTIFRNSRRNDSKALHVELQSRLARVVDESLASRIRDDWQFRRSGLFFCRWVVSADDEELRFRKMNFMYQLRHLLCDRGMRLEFPENEILVEIWLGDSDHGVVLHAQACLEYQQSMHHTVAQNIRSVERRCRNLVRPVDTDAHEALDDPPVASYEVARGLGAAVVDPILSCIPDTVDLGAVATQLRPLIRCEHRVEIFRGSLALLRRHGYGNLEGVHRRSPLYNMALIVAIIRDERRRGWTHHSQAGVSGELGALWEIVPEIQPRVVQHDHLVLPFQRLVSEAAKGVR